MKYLVIKKLLHQIREHLFLFNTEKFNEEKLDQFLDINICNSMSPTRCASRIGVVNNFDAKINLNMLTRRLKSGQ